MLINCMLIKKTVYTCELPTTEKLPIAIKAAASVINYFSISVYILVKTAYTFVCGDRFVVGIPQQTGHCSQTIYFSLQK